jgi:hypothetical protein
MTVLLRFSDEFPDREETRPPLLFGNDSGRKTSE